MTVLKFSEVTGDIEEFEIDLPIMEIESCECEKAGNNVELECCKKHNPISY